MRKELKDFQKFAPTARVISASSLQLIKYLSPIEIKHFDIVMCVLMLGYATFLISMARIFKKDRFWHELTSAITLAGFIYVVTFNLTNIQNQQKPNSYQETTVAKEKDSNKAEFFEKALEKAFQKAFQNAKSLNGSISNNDVESLKGTISNDNTKSLNGAISTDKVESKIYEGHHHKDHPYIPYDELCTRDHSKI